MYAKDMGKFDAYHKATFRTFWDESKNIGEPEVLKGVFEECGLDWEEYHTPENHIQYDQRVEAELAEARTYGITGVPSFIIDRYLLVGAQPYGVFQQVMARIQNEKPLQGLWLPGQGMER